jgi:hypothetical protein
VPNTWFRFYHEWDSDPKVQMMPENMQRRLAMLFCWRCKEETFQETRAAFHWRISLEEIAKTKAVFMENGFIDENWELLNWNRRQFLSDSSTDRVRRHRHALKQDETLHETVVPVTVTPPDTDTEQKQKKPSRAKKARATKTAEVDARHMAFKAAIKAYWDYKNPGLEMPWGPAEGQQLGMWLREAPNITLVQFQGMLKARAKSKVNHGDRPCQWIRWITSYGPGPVNEFKNTIQEGGAYGESKPSAAKQRVDANRTVLAEIAVERGWYVPAGAAQPDGETVPEPGPSGDGGAVGVHEGLRAVEPEILPPRS